ncbi:unnamed protein product, partial [Rotaria sp. Silwood1]
WNACQALGQMDEKAATSEVINRLISALGDSNDHVRWSACQALGNMGEKAATSEAINRLISALGDSNDSVRWSACQALGNMGEKAATSEAINRLISALGDGNDSVRWGACEALGKMGEKAATSDVTNGLISALGDSNDSVRWGACEALGKMGEKAATNEAINGLISALGDNEFNVRSSAREALDKMGKKAATSDVINGLISALRDSNYNVRWNVCQALGNMGEKAATSEVIYRLISALGDSNDHVRWSACQALGNMGEKAATSEAINRLISALGDSNDSVSVKPDDIVKFRLNEDDQATKHAHLSTNLKEMCVACRTIHHDNTSELKDIDYLEKHYDAEKAIEYYTKPWFLFRTVNQICRTENIKDIYKFRIYISDLHQKLNQLSMEQERNNIKSSLEKVYHGKPLSGSVLQQLIDNKDHLISMNGFLSTTSDSKICNIYAGVEELIDEGYKGVLFVFEIDKVIKQPYADISKFSTIPDEAEILFSLGTIWRIKSIRHDEGSCTIELTSCNEFDSDLTQLREKYTGDNVSLLSLGDVLLELGDEDTAEWAYRKMLSQHINDNETCGILYYKI